MRAALAAAILASLTVLAAPTQAAAAFTWDPPTGAGVVDDSLQKAVDTMAEAQGYATVAVVTATAASAVVAGAANGAVYTGATLVAAGLEETDLVMCMSTDCIPGYRVVMLALDVGQVAFVQAAEARSSGEKALFESLAAAVSGVASGYVNHSAIASPLVVYAKTMPPAMAERLAEVALAWAGTLGAPGLALCQAVECNPLYIVVSCTEDVVQCLAKLVAEGLSRLTCLQYGYCGVPVFQVTVLTQVVVSNIVFTKEGLDSIMLETAGLALTEAQRPPDRINATRVVAPLLRVPPLLTTVASGTAAGAQAWASGAAAYVPWIVGRADLPLQTCMALECDPVYRILQCAEGQCSDLGPWTGCVACDPLAPEKRLAARALGEASWLASRDPAVTQLAGWCVAHPAWCAEGVFVFASYLWWGPPLLQFTVLVQVVVNNAVHTKMGAQDAAAGSIAQAAAPGPEPWAAARPAAGFAWRTHEEALDGAPMAVLYVVHAAFDA